MSYLIESRRPDVVAVTNSELGYQLLPFLVSQHPRPLWIDINHMEEEYWRSGGYPRFSVGVNAIVDHSVAISEHLRRWMVQRGADPAKVTALHIGVDTSRWRRSEAARARVRELFRIPADAVVFLFVGRLACVPVPVFGSAMPSPSFLIRAGAVLRRTRTCCSRRCSS